MTRLGMRWISNSIHDLRPRAAAVLRRVQHNELVRTSFLSGIASGINILSVFVAQKVIAVLLGPAGVALVSQYQNFVGIVTALANGGINSGIVKYVAEFRTKPDQNALFISNAVRITLMCSGVLSLGLLLFAEQLSSDLFGNVQYAFIIRLLGLTLTLFAFNSLLVAVLNGFGEIRKYALSFIARSTVVLVLTICLSLLFGVTGALVALSITQSIVFFITLFFVVRSSWFNRVFFMQKVDWKIVRKLLGFSIVAFLTFIIDPYVRIAIRSHMIDTLSIDQAGQWDAMMKISQGYLAILTGTLAVYYLPKLSALTLRRDLVREITNGYRIVLPVLLVWMAVVYLLRQPIVSLLYTSEFTLTLELFLPVLVSDYIGMVSWLMAYLLIAKAKNTLNAVITFVFYPLLYILSVTLIDNFGLLGAAYAQIIKSLLYLVVIGTVFTFVLLPEMPVERSEEKS